VAKTGEIINITDAYQDRRFDSDTDASSGFRTRTILAAPLTTPSGEIVGVVEVLNKRNRVFSKEDEEFLAEVGTHSALAVEGVREHEAAVARARREGVAAALRGIRALFEPAGWPETAGFESTPLRWESPQGSLIAYAAAAGAGFSSLLLLEAPDPPEESVAALAGALAAGRALLASSSPADILEKIQEAAPSCSATSLRWEGSRLSLCAARAPLPFLLRGGKAVRLDASEEGARRTAVCETLPGDLAVVASSGLERLRFEGDWRPPEQLVEELAAGAATGTLQNAFAQSMKDWKAAGISPGSADVLLLAMRRVLSS
jgi:hypothetical protein